MKKLFIATLIGFSTYAFSQTVNNVPIKEIDVDYVQIVGNERLFSNKVNVEIDFGQDTKFFKDGTSIRDEKGNLVKFNSMMDALNFMSKNGYTFQFAYTRRGLETDVQDQFTYFILKKK